MCECFKILNSFKKKTGVWKNIEINFNKYYVIVLFFQYNVIMLGKNFTYSLSKNNKQRDKLGEEQSCGRRILLLLVYFVL